MNKQKKNYWKVILLFLFIVLFLLLLLRTCGSSDSTNKELSKNLSTETDQPIDTVPVDMDTVSFDSSSDINDTIVEQNKPGPAPLKPVTTVTKKADSVVLVPQIKNDTLIDTIQRSIVSEPEDLSANTIDTSACASDTSELWVYPDPSGGLHRRPQSVRFYSNRLSSIQWRMSNSSDWVEYNGGEIQIEKTGTLIFTAVDTCGRRMENREEYYEIEVASQSDCPPDMGHVLIGDLSFCVDIYEWPNRKGVRPLSYISFYQAGDSCFSVGKRLCTVDEWMLACSGPYSTRYPYGDIYEKHACATTDTVVNISGGKPECRSHFGLYDMSGNLQEWTDTRSTENNRFNYVAGGFWDSGVKSSCAQRRYSYYTQNQHNSVGFRCCKDIKTQNKNSKN